MRYVSIIINT